MKKIITLALISIITSNINAQFDATNMTFSDGERYIMNKWTPKNGKTSDFMKAAGKKTKLFNNSPENAIVTYQVLNGPDTGQFLRINLYATMENFVGYNSNNSEEREYWEKNVIPLTQSNDGPTIWRRLSSRSNNWPDPNDGVIEPSKYMVVDTYTVSSEGYADHREIIGKIYTIIKEGGSTAKTSLFKVESGGNPNTYMRVRMFDDPNERAQWAEQERTFEQMYNQRYGYRSFEKDSQTLNESIMSWSKTSEIVMFVPSMSAGN